MKQKIDKRVPRCNQLINPTFRALKNLGGSGNNEEILMQLIEILALPDAVVDIPHKDSSMSELAYQAAWARTYLRKCDIIINSTRSVWSIAPDYAHQETIDERLVISQVRNPSGMKPDDAPPKTPGTPENDEPPESVGLDCPDEIKPWRSRLDDILHNMDPFAFERLAQRILRECGFSQVEVTKKTGDGGIDGTGKLKINGIFSFNVAFQCKRYKGLVGASAIRDFRGSLTTDIEKGVLITTGAFSKAAREEASNPGKQQIDLIDGEELISKIAEFGIGVREVRSYEVDEEFFKKI